MQHSHHVRASKTDRDSPRRHGTLFGLGNEILVRFAGFACCNFLCVEIFVAQLRPFRLRRRYIGLLQVLNISENKQNKQSIRCRPSFRRADVQTKTNNDDGHRKSRNEFHALFHYALPPRSWAQPQRGLFAEKFAEKIKTSKLLESVSLTEHLETLDREGIESVEDIVYANICRLPAAFRAVCMAFGLLFFHLCAMYGILSVTLFSGIFAMRIMQIICDYRDGFVWRKPKSIYIGIFCEFPFGCAEDVHCLRKICHQPAAIRKLRIIPR